MTRLPASARALLAALAIFLLGTVAGIVLDRTALRTGHGVRAGGPERHHEGIVAELQEELRLSPTQAVRVHEILTRRQGEIADGWAQIHTNLRRAIRETTAELETVLDSAQTERLHAWLAERHGSAAEHGPDRRHQH